jgi:membrane protein DedA with SNARE-associated domain
METGVVGVSGLAALVLLLPVEAGVPIPLSADLVMFTVGERVAAGRLPLWLAVVGFEVIAAIGTTALFVARRGSGHRIVARYGPRIGLTQERVRRGVSGLSGRRALSALILGSSVFLQVHLVLGLLLGPLAARTFDQAKGPALGAVAVLAAGALVFWRARRRNRIPAVWTEAACPACLGVRALAERIPGLTELVPGLAETAAADPAGSGPDDQPTALAS